MSRNDSHTSRSAASGSALRCSRTPWYAPLRYSSLPCISSKCGGSRLANKRLSNRGKYDANGFTIIELMIATLVFSVVLVLISVGVINFNKAYYKGVVQSSTQNTARTVLENISQAIQFSGAGQPVTPPAAGPGGEQYFCAGSQRYTYLPGWQLSSSSNGPVHQTTHALVEDAPASGCSAAQDFTNPLAAGSTELLGQHMRVSSLKIVPLPHSTYTVDVRIVYGDDDLLCSPNEVAGSCASTSAMPVTGDYQTPDLQCKSSAGSQFCAVSDLTTTVQKRIN